MQLRLEVGHHLARAAREQPLEGRPLEVLHQHVGRVLEVVVLLLLDAALVARLRQPALVVLAEDRVVDLVDLAHPVLGAAEDARGAPVHERDAPALAAGQARERRDQRRAPHGDAVGERARQLQRLEHAGRLGGEHRQRLSALGGQVALQQRARALQARAQCHAVVVRQLVVVADAAIGLVEQRAHRRRARRRGRELRRIEVEIEAEHNGPIEAHFREPAHLVAVRSRDLHALLLPERPGRDTALRFVSNVHDLTEYLVVYASMRGPGRPGHKTSDLPYEVCFR